MVGLGRLELPTSPLSGARSSHLSYRPNGSAVPSMIAVTRGGGQVKSAGGIGKDHRIPLAKPQCMSPKRVKELELHLDVRRAAMPWLSSVPVGRGAGTDELAETLWVYIAGQTEARATKISRQRDIAVLSGGDP